MKLPRAYASRGEEYGGSVDDLLDQIGGFGHCQLCATFFAFAMWMAHAGQVMSMVYVSAAQQREWGDATLVRAAPTLFFLGWMCGLLGFWARSASSRGWLATTRLVVTLSALFGLCGAIAPTPLWFGISRAACGFAEGAVPLLTFSYASELCCHPRHRARVGALIQQGYPLGVALLTLCSWYVASWRRLSAGVSCTALPIAFAATSYLPESPRWLSEAGSHAQFTRSLRRVAMLNGRPPPSDGLRPARSGPRGVATGASLVDSLWGKGGSGNSGATGGDGGSLFSARRVLARVTVQLCVLWLTASCLYFGLALDTRRLRGSQQSNMGASLSLQPVLAVCHTLALERWGRALTLRRVLACVVVCCVGLALTAHTLQPQASTQLTTATVGTTQPVGAWHVHDAASIGGADVRRQPKSLYEMYGDGADAYRRYQYHYGDDSVGRDGPSTSEVAQRMGPSEQVEEEEEEEHQGQDGGDGHEDADGEGQVEEQQRYELEQETPFNEEPGGRDYRRPDGGRVSDDEAKNDDVDLRPPPPVAAAAAAATAAATAWYAFLPNAFSAVARALAAVLSNGVYIYSNELWPTQVRPLGMSAGSVSARLGGAAAPALWALDRAHPSAPYLIAALLAAIAAYATRGLPETRGSPSLDTCAQLVELVHAHERGAAARAAQGLHSSRKEARRGGSKSDVASVDDEDDASSDGEGGEEAPLLGASPISVVTNSMASHQGRGL